MRFVVVDIIVLAFLFIVGGTLILPETLVGFIPFVTGMAILVCIVPIMHYLSNKFPFIGDRR